MTETIVVNLFLWVRVFLVGGILFLFPRITRKGLLFGVYVGEEFSDGVAAKKVVQTWDRGCAVVMVSALLVGLSGSLAGRAVAGNLTGTVVLLLGGVVLYFRTHSRVKALDRPDMSNQAGRAIASLECGNPGGETFARITLVTCLVVSLATVVYGLLSYQAMPDRVPAASRILGVADTVTEKSFVAVMYVPGWNLVLSTLYALLALMMTTAKRSLRENPESGSGKAQDVFRTTSVYVFSGAAILVCALLTLYSVQRIRIGLGEINSTGNGIYVLMITIIGGGITSLYLLIRRCGQGGSLIEQNNSPGALTGGLADNRHWTWGVFYVNRDDPSLMVENRFGIGYTMNYGNRNSILFVSIFVALLLSLIVIGIIFL